VLVEVLGQTAAAPALDLLCRPQAEALAMVHQAAQAAAGVALQLACKDRMAAPIQVMTLALWAAAAAAHTALVGLPMVIAEARVELELSALSQGRGFITAAAAADLPTLTLFTMVEQAVLAEAVLVESKPRVRLVPQIQAAAAATQPQAVQAQTLCES
jgi:hypothetical protein